MSDSPAKEMFYFDMLPDAVRVAMNYSYARHSSQEVFSYWQQNGASEEELIKVIALTDAHLVRQEYSHGRS